MRESKNGKKKQNKKTESSGILLPGISFISDVIFGITSLQFGELNVAIFSFITVVFLIIWIWLTVAFYKNKKRKKESYENKKEQYLDRCDESIGLKEIYKTVKKNDEEYTNKCRGKNRSYICISLIFAFGIIVNSYMIVSQYHAMKETGEMETDFASADVNSNLNETTSNVEATLVNEGVGNKGITPEEKKEMQNKTFILSEPERLEVLSDKDETRVFYVSLDEDKSKEEVKKHLDAIFSQKKRSTISKNSAEEELAAEAQRKEDVFLEGIEAAKYYRTQENYEAWRCVVPSSITLEEIMKTRGILLTALSEDRKIDGVWYFRSANNNQLFADEYRRQGGKPETVVYYYVEAIKMTEEGLAYEDISQEYKSQYFRYLKARYKDIADYVQNHLERFGAGKEKYYQLMKKANAIYKYM